MLYLSDVFNRIQQHVHKIGVSRNCQWHAINLTQQQYLHFDLRVFNRYYSTILYTYLKKNAITLLFNCNVAHTHNLLFLLICHFDTTPRAENCSRRR